MSITIEIRLINLLVNHTVKAKAAALEGVEVQLMKEAKRIHRLKKESQRNIAVVEVQRRVQKEYLNNISLFFCKLRRMRQHQIHLYLSRVPRLQ